MGGTAATAIVNTSATSIQFTTPAGNAGSSDVIVTAAGGSATASAGFTYVAPAVPVPVPAPTVAAQSVAVAYNAPAQAISLSATGTVTRFAIATGPSHGAATLTGSTVTYVPTTGYVGSDSFAYTATGPGGTSSAATVSLTVAAPPAPVIASPAPVISNASDANGQVTVVLAPLTGGVTTGYRIVVSAGNGQASIEAPSSSQSQSIGLRAVGSGQYRLVYTPNPNFMGTDTVSVAAYGPGGQSAPALFTFQVLGKAPDLTVRIPSNGVATFAPTSGLTGGPFQQLRVTQAPAFGTVTINGLTVVFSPTLSNSGSATIGYVIDLPFGSSAPGTLTVQTDPVPIPAALTATTMSGRPVTVELTAGAQGGPFTGATVASLSSPAAGTATIVQGGTGSVRTFALTFTPQGDFTGRVNVAFTLTNAFATSTGSVAITVEPRPDPSLDVEVRGVVSSQAESARHFITTQTDNFMHRLEQLRHGHNDDSNQLSLNLGFAGERQGLDPREALQRQFGLPVMGDNREPATLASMVAEPSVPGMPRGLSLGGRNDGSGSSALSAAPASGPTGDSRTDKDQVASKLGVWAAGSVDWGRRDAVTGQRDYRITTSGLTAGADVKLSDTLIVGAGMGYGQDRTLIGDKGSVSEGRNRVGAVYGSWKVSDAVVLDGVAGYGLLDYNERRWAAPASAFAFGKRSGSVTFASASVAWDRVDGAMTWSPYGRVQAASVTLDPYSETGAGMYSLAYDRLAFDTLASTLGIHWDWRVQQHERVFTPSLRVEWVHEFQDTGGQSVRYDDFVASPNYSVSLDGWSRDRVNVNVGGQAAFGQSLLVGVEYRGGYDNRGVTHGVELRMTTRF